VAVSLQFVLLLLQLAGLAGCATSSTITVPTCAERVEVEGEHVRLGNTLRFDHSLDPPWSSTELIIERDGEQRTVVIPNTRPDGGRLLVGSVLGLVGGAVVATAMWEVAVGGGTFAWSAAEPTSPCSSTDALSICRRAPLACALFSSMSSRYKTPACAANTA
jgi:hypothetical protein